MLPKQRFHVQSAPDLSTEWKPSNRKRPGFRTFWCGHWPKLWLGYVQFDLKTGGNHPQGSIVGLVENDDHHLGFRTRKTQQPEWFCFRSSSKIQKNIVICAVIATVLWFFMVVFRHPSEKWWSSSVGIMFFPTEWKVIKFPGSKPPTSRYLYTYYMGVS